MQLEYFNYLIEIGRHSSMSKASEHLHLSPQALSIAISKLEADLNCKLVLTTNKGTHLTETGKILAKESEKFFDVLDSIKSTQNKLKQDHTLTDINFIAVHGIKENSFTDVLRTLRDKNPTIKFNIEYHSLREVFTVLKDNPKEDVIYFLYLTQIKGQSLHDIPYDFVFHKLATSRLYCIINKANFASDLSSVSLKQLLKLPIPAVTLENFESSIADIVSYYDPKYRIKTESSSNFLASSLTHNDCYTFTLLSNSNESLISVPKDCVAIRVHENIQAAFGLLHSKKLADPQIEKILHMIVDLY